MKIVIPMAGLGSRFQNEAHRNPEYLKPKPFIDVKGYPMIRWATGSLPFLKQAEDEDSGDYLAGPEDLIFIVLKEHEDKYGLKEKLQGLYSGKAQVMVIPALTRGAAETAFQACDLVDPEEELIVSDSDHHFDGRKLGEVIRHKDADTAGVIPVFKVDDQNPKWSYSLLDCKGGRSAALTHKSGNYIIAVGEKDVELAKKGALANIGAYYYSRAGLFFEEVKEMIERNEMYGAADKQEFYVAPVYDRLIKKGYKVQAAVLDRVYGLGTPADLEYFALHYNRDLRERR